MSACLAIGFHRGCARGHGDEDKYECVVFFSREHNVVVVGFFLAYKLNSSVSLSCGWRSENDLQWEDTDMSMSCQLMKISETA